MPASDSVCVPCGGPASDRSAARVFFTELLMSMGQSSAFSSASTSRNSASNRLYLISCKSIWRPRRSYSACNCFFSSPAAFFSAGSFKDRSRTRRSISSCACFELAVDGDDALTAEYVILDKASQFVAPLLQLALLFLLLAFGFRLAFLGCLGLPRNSTGACTRAGTRIGTAFANIGGIRLAIILRLLARRRELADLFDQPQRIIQRAPASSALPAKPMAAATAINFKSGGSAKPMAV